MKRGIIILWLLLLISVQAIADVPEAPNISSTPHEDEILGVRPLDLKVRDMSRR